MLRHVELLTVAQCAQHLEVSECTLYNYMREARFAELIETMRAKWGEQGRTEVLSLVQQAMATMRDLMSPATRSEHVRFEAAKAVGDWAGIQLVPKEQQEDQRDEVTRLTRLVAQRLTKAPKQDIHVYMGMLQPDSLLPTTHVSAAGQRLQELYGQEQREQSEQSVVEGEVRED